MVYSLRKFYPILPVLWSLPTAAGALYELWELFGFIGKNPVISPPTPFHPRPTGLGFFLTHAWISTQPKTWEDLFADLQSSLCVWFYPRWYSACKLSPPQLSGAPVSVSSTQQDRRALSHSPLPAPQLGDRLQAVNRAFHFSSFRDYSPMLLVSIAWNCYFMDFSTSVFMVESQFPLYLILGEGKWKYARY